VRGMEAPTRGGPETCANVGQRSDLMSGLSSLRRYVAPPEAPLEGWREVSM